MPAAQAPGRTELMLRARTDTTWALCVPEAAALYSALHTDASTLQAYGMAYGMADCAPWPLPLALLRHPR